MPFNAISAERGEGIGFCLKGCRHLKRRPSLWAERVGRIDLSSSLEP